MSVISKVVRTDLLLFAAAALGAVLVIATTNRPTTSELKTRQENVFVAFDPTAIESIKLTSKGSGSSVFLRNDPNSDDPHRYFLGKKGKRVADLSQMAKLVSALEFSSWKRLLEEDSAPDDAQLGFSEPRIELRISAGPRSYRLLIGAKAPTPEHSVYARVEGVSIQPRTGVVSEEFAQKLARRNQEFRGSALFPYSKSSTSSLSIANKKHSFQLDADHLGFLLKDHRIADRPVERADRELSDLIFYQLARASITTFLDAKTVEKSLDADPRRLTVTQRGVDGPEYRSVIGGDCPGDPSRTLAMRSAPDRVQGCVTRSVLPALRMSPQDLRSVVATPLHADEIDHVVIKEPTRQLELIRREAHYSLLSHDSRHLDSQAGDELLEVLANGKLTPSTKPVGVQKFSSLRIVGNSSLSAEPPVPVPPGQEPPFRAAELRLSTYKSESDLFLHREEDDQWFQVAGWLSWAFSADSSWTKKRRFFEELSIMSASVLYPSGHTESVIRADKEVTFEGDGFNVDQRLATRLFDEIEHLEAVRFLPESTPSPAKVLLEVSWTSSKTPHKRKTLRIGPRTRGGFLASGTFTEGVFVLPLRTVSTLRMPLTSRQPANLSVLSFTRLEARVDGRVYKFEKRADVLSAAGGEATDDMVHPLMDAMQGISVLAAAGSHPLARSLSRGPERLILSGTYAASGTERTFQLHVGPPVVFQDESAFVGWLEGSAENYVLSKRGLDSLMALL